MHSMRTVSLGVAVRVGTCLRSDRRPTQQSVQGWNARTAIHSLTSTASTSPEDVATSSLPMYLCYSCHTTLTSRSSRSTKSLNPDPSGTASTSSTVNLPTWAAARLASGLGDAERASSAAPTTAAEIWETRKLDRGLMDSRLGEFLLDR
jgi:cytoplasmic tRNA 2-thiolation protein 2